MGSTELADTQTFACPCLNVAITAKLLSGEQNAGFPVQVNAINGLTAEHAFLTHASFSAESPHEAVFRCLNCATNVARYLPAGSDPHTLPANGQMTLGTACLHGEALEALRMHESRSHAFRILMEPPNAPEPHISPATTAASASIASASMMPVNIAPLASLHSPVMPKHAQTDPTSSIKARLTQGVRQYRAEIERRVSVLREAAEAYANRTLEEADVLAARAGIKRGGFTHSTLHSPSVPRQTAAVSSTSALPAVSGDSGNALSPIVATSIFGQSQDPMAPSQAIALSPNRSEKSRMGDAVKKKITPSPYPVSVIRPPLPTGLSSQGSSRSQSAESIEGKRERKVTFMDPTPVQAQKPSPQVLSLTDAGEPNLCSYVYLPRLGPTCSTDVESSDDGEDGEGMFELDEELPEQSRSDESDTDAYGPETPRLSSPDMNLQKNVVSSKDFDQSKAAQARQMRELLAVDLPSHRKSGRRQSSQAEESDSIDSSNGTGSISGEAPAKTTFFPSSLPIDIDLQHPRRESPAAESTQGFINPGMRSAPQKSNVSSTFATSLREATERALADAATARRPARAVPAAAEPIAFSKTPLDNQELIGSFRGPSSLTSALAKGLPPSALGSRQPLSSTIEESAPFDVGAHEEGAEDPTEFVPPHLLTLRSRGDEGLLSTSVHDLYRYE